MEDLTKSFVELVRRAATDLPADVEGALRAAQSREEPGETDASAEVEWAWELQTESRQTGGQVGFDAGGAL